jgi:protoporphyrinogen oxidase
VKTPIWQISSSAKGKVELQLSDGKIAKYDRVLVTTPSHIFAKLIERQDISASYLQSLKAVQYLGAVVAVFTSKQKISDYYWHNINDANAPFLVFIHHTQLVEKERYGGDYVYYIGAYLPHDHRYFGLPQEDIYREWFAYLQKVFPDFDDKQVVEQYLFKLQHAQHIVDTDYASNIPGAKTPLSGVYLSNFAQIFPEDSGTNYAVREGKKIAAQILNELE